MLGWSSCLNKDDLTWIRSSLSVKSGLQGLQVLGNTPFPSCCEPHYESQAKCKAFHISLCPVLGIRWIFRFSEFYIFLVTTLVIAWAVWTDQSNTWSLKGPPSSTSFPGSLQFLSRHSPRVSLSRSKARSGLGSKVLLKTTHIAKPEDTHAA